MACYPHKKTFFFFKRIPQGTINACFLTWATVTILGRFPVIFTLTFLDLGLVKECCHPCFIPIWRAVQRLMTVTSSKTNTQKCVSLLWQIAISGEVKGSSHHILLELHMCQCDNAKTREIWYHRTIILGRNSILISENITIRKKIFWKYDFSIFLPQNWVEVVPIFWPEWLF